MKIRTYLALFVITHLIILSMVSTVASNAEIPLKNAADPLPSWEEGLIKAAIIGFITNTTNVSHPDYVDPEERIATFDNDGTLLCELPDVVQVSFMLDRIREMAPRAP